MGSGGGMSSGEIYAAQKAAREAAEKEAQQEQARKQAQAQSAADNANVTTEGGEGTEGALSDAKKKRGSTLAGSGEATFTAKSGKLGE